MSVAKVLVVVERGLAYFDCTANVEVIIVDRDVNCDEDRVEIPNDAEWKDLVESLFADDHDANNFIKFAP